MTDWNRQKQPHNCLSFDSKNINNILIVTGDVTVLTVATDDNHGLERFLRSAKVFDINVEILGRGEKWSGGDMNFAGGGQKVNLLKDKLNELVKSETNKDHIILFTDRFVF